MTSDKRAVALPELPTLSEAGVPGYEATSWYGAFAPAGTPPEVMMKMESDLVALLKTQEMQGQLLAQGAEAIGNTAEQFANVLKDELAKWAKVVQSSGARVD